MVRESVPPGVLVIEETGPVVIGAPVVNILDTFKGMISQMDDPDHDWMSNPAGPKVLSIDILDSTDGLSIKTTLLADPEGRLYRLFPLEERVPGAIWDYIWSLQPTTML